MKRIFMLCSAIGLTVAQANTAAASENGRISISSGDRHLSISVATPTVSDDELNAAINRLAQSSQNFGTPANQGAYVQQQSVQSYPNYAQQQSVQTYPSYAQQHISTVTPTYTAAPVSTTQNIQVGVQAPKSNKLDSSAAPSVAARVLTNMSHSRTQGRCATYVRKALQAAGYKFKPQESAYMYATKGTLQEAGFVKISKEGYNPQVGDVVVWHRSAKHPHGHIQIWNGNQWVSDFRQRKISPYTVPTQYTVWRDARYLDASTSQGTYLAMNEQ